MPQHMYLLHKQKELRGPFWSREFAVAHEDIDDDINEDERVKRRAERAARIGGHEHEHKLLEKQADNMDATVRESERVTRRAERERRRRKKESVSSS